MPDLSLRKMGLHFAVVALLLALGWFVVGQLWPVYILANKLPSPDRRYVVAVVKGDKAAFDDFFYRVYIFRQAAAPEIETGERIWMRGRWADKNFLVYEGYSVPALRWTSAHELEVDLDEAHYDVRTFNPAPSLHERRQDNSSGVLVSLLLNKSDKRDVLP